MQLYCKSVRSSTNCTVTYLLSAACISSESLTILFFDRTTIIFNHFYTLCCMLTVLEFPYQEMLRTLCAVVKVPIRHAAPGTYIRLCCYVVLSMRVLPLQHRVWVFRYIACIYMSRCIILPNILYNILHKHLIKALLSQKQLQCLVV